MAKETGTALEHYRQELERLDWSKGLTVRELIEKCPDCPRMMFDDLPLDERFPSFQGFWNRFSIGEAARRIGSLGYVTASSPLRRRR